MKIGLIENGNPYCFIDLTIKERNLLIDGLSDTLYRLRYDKILKRNKIYQNAIVRLKDKMKLTLKYSIPNESKNNQKEMEK